MHSTLLIVALLQAAVGAPTQAAVAPKDTAPDVALVCPAEFRAAMQPWIDYRTAQGHAIALVPSDGTAADIQGRIRTLAKAGRLKYVVLVGDADPNPKGDRAIAARSVPAHMTRAKVNLQWGSEPLIATDNAYGDLDGDLVPDVAVGRLSADSPQQLRTIVAKTLAYEKSVDFGQWRRQVHFVAGVGGFGAIADAVLESGAKKFITDGVPPGYRTTMTYASWQSPYCPDPRRFHQTAVERLNDGCLFWVYIGHGNRHWLDQVRVPGRRFHILDCRDVGELDCAAGSPIAIFLACYSGAFDDPRDCLAEEMLRTPRGPVAVLAGSRVTMPYAMSVMGTEMMDACFRDRQPTIGQIMLQAKREMTRVKGIGARRLMLDLVAKTISPSGTDLAEERQEHLALFNLMGDPLLTIRHPEPIEVAAPKMAVAGDTIEVSGQCSLDGVCTVELVVRRDRTTFTPETRREFVLEDEQLSAYQRVYQRANDHRLAAVEVPVREGKFSAMLKVPESAAGACHVRAFVPGRKQFALGAADVRVAAPPQEERPRSTAD